MTNKITLTIQTATLNRGHIIERAYRSLQNQTCQDFDWVVVDDGSTDNTQDLFVKWIQEDNGFTITYYKQENGGLCRARNKGLELVTGRYVFMLDSDDYLTSDTVEKLHAWIAEIDAINDIVGVGAVIGDKNGAPLKGSLPYVNEKLGYVDATNLERAQYNMDVDMREAYKTDILKQYPFPVWPSEKFAPEGIVMNEMALHGYKLRWHSDVIYICEYMPDGLTQGAWNLERQNPMGYAMLANHQLKYSKSFMARCRLAARHIALSIVGKGYRYMFESNAPLLTLITLPYGIALSFRKKRQYKMDAPPS